MEHLYPEEVARRRAQGGLVAEASCLAERLTATGAVSRTAMEIIRFTLQCAVLRGVSELLIAVHPDHAKFYRRLGWMAIGEERTYGAVCDNPAVPLSLKLDLSHIAENYPRTHKMFFSEWFPEDVFRNRPVSRHVMARMEATLRQLQPSTAAPKPRFSWSDLLPDISDAASQAPKPAFA
jgi:hypothetical protein